MTSAGDAPRGPTVLIVDDEEPIRTALQRFLKGLALPTFTAASGAEALQLLRGNPVALMLADIRMPGMSGIDLVPQALALDPDLAVVMLSAVNDATTAALCMQRGAMDYLTKPLDLDDLARAVQGALRRREERRATRELDQRAKESLARERARASRLTVATLEALVNIMESRDPYLRGHSARVADLAATIAAHLGLADDVVEAARLAGRLHDIGKIGTREAVLNKHGPLSPEENEHIKQHVLIGSQLLAPIDELRPILGGVRNHHERWDGSGYPDGLKGEEIPLLARIIGAVEIYDALCTSRPYQEKMSPYEAVQRMGEFAGSALDPRVYASLAEVVRRRRSLVFLESGDAPGP